MKNWLKREINGLITTTQKWQFVLYASLISFIFIHVFEPFDIYSVSSVSFIETFIEFTLAIIVAGLVLMFTQFLVRKWLNIEKFTNGKFILWFLLDIVLISWCWEILDELTTIEKELRLNGFLEYTITAFFLMMIPYFGAAFVLDYQQNKKSHQELLEKSISNSFPVPTLVHFKDEKEVERISLQAENILYLQSNDNYVAIFYIENEKVEQYLLRNSIKKLESLLAPFSIIRCHRSFMVNTSNIISKKKKGNSFIVKIKQIEEVDIPISKAYSSEIDKLIRVG